MISHHFSNHKIEGLTVVDELGTSFSYERDNLKVKQNFTLCHELGHFILKHEGNYFAELIDNQENLLEREANIFSAVILFFYQKYTIVARPSIKYKIVSKFQNRLYFFVF